MFEIPGAKLENIYNLEGHVPLPTAIYFGLQHILAMFVSNVAPLILISNVAQYNGVAFTDVETTMLIQNCMVIASIATLVQCFPLFKTVGSGLPIVMGVSFTFFAPMMLYASEDYGIAIGTIIVGGIIEAILGLTVKYWKNLIPHIVTACVVVAIGFSLIDVGVTSFAGGEASKTFQTTNPLRFGSIYNLLVGSITLVSALLWQSFAKGFLKATSILVGLFLGYISAMILTLTNICPMVDFKNFGETISILGLLSFPQIITYTPRFEIGAIISVVLVFFVTTTETIGNVTAIARDGLNRDVTEKELKGAITLDGLFSALSGGLFGITPITSFSQNVGIICMTRVVNKYCVAMGATILMLAGFVSPIGAFFASIPECVIGGCTIMIFGSIIVVGIKMVCESGMNKRNAIIAATSLSLGLGVTIVDERFFNVLPSIFTDIFYINPVAGVFVIAFLLNIIFKEKTTEKIEEKVIG